MNILYLLGNYPQISETYVSNEISFAQKNGSHVEVWARNAIVEDVPAQCPVHRGTVAEAVEAAKPDLVHMHYLVMAEARIHEVPAGIPITIRSHSFDWSAARAEKLAAIPEVRKIYAFPHFARELQHPKVTALPVAYNSSLHRPSAWKDRRLVLRLGAALPSKGLSDFFDAARLLPEWKFTLAAVRAGGGDEYPARLRAMASEGRVELLFDRPCLEAAVLAAAAGIYLDTSDPAMQRFGMPISIAEAMATGSLVLVRRSSAAAEYIGNAGLLYDSVDHAAGLIRETSGWSEGRWQEAGRAAIAMASLYRDTELLPVIMNDWKAIAGKV